MDELKPGWSRVKFGDVVRLSKERCADPLSAGIDRYIGLEHIEPGDLRVRTWGDVADGTTFTSCVRPGQVLFGKRRAYLQKVGLADFPAVCSSDIYVLESISSNKLLSGLLPFLCRTEGFFNHAVGTSAGSLSPRTSWSNLSNYEFFLPSIHRQEKILNLLRVQEKASQTLRSMLEGSRSCIASLRLKLLPPSLVMGPPLSNVCKTSIEKASLVKGDIFPLAGVLSEGRGLCDQGTISSDTTNYAHLHVLRTSRLVMRKLTAWEGPITVVPEEFDGFVVSPEFPTFEIDQNKVLPEYMRQICMCPWFWHEMKRRCKGSVLRRMRLNASDLLQIPIKFPDTSEQAQILEQIGAMESVVKAATARHAAACSLQKAMLAKVMGESE